MKIHSNERESWVRYHAKSWTEALEHARLARNLLPGYALASVALRTAAGRNRVSVTYTYRHAARSRLAEDKLARETLEAAFGMAA